MSGTSVTINRNYDLPEADGRQPAKLIIQLIHNALVAIDVDINQLIADVQAISGIDLSALITSVGINTANISTLAADITSNDTDISNNATNITTLTNTKEDARTRETTTDITRDGEGRITFYSDGLVTQENFVYNNSTGLLESFDETVNSNTETVNLSYDSEGRVESISYS